MEKWESVSPCSREQRKKIPKINETQPNKKKKKKMNSESTLGKLTHMRPAVFPKFLSRESELI